MALEDYAIVVGINNYPGLNAPPTPTADLQSPNIDAEAVANWLRTAGGLKPENVSEIHTGLPIPPGPVVPRQALIREAFRKLDDIAEQNRKQGKLKVGRRLYLYMSGHGFSPKRHQGALYTTDATSRDPLHCYASAWLEWFQDAAYFEEYVLWMDCCMDRVFTYIPEPMFPPRGGTNATGLAFVGLAAQRTLKTVERVIPEDGKVHGVFTWTLLKGLEQARDAAGQVTGSSLGRYLINTMKTYLSPEDQANAQIANEPEISFADERLVFVKQVPPQKCGVTFAFEAALAAREVKVWSGSPPSSQDFVTNALGRIEANLGLGLYVVEMPSAGLRQSFEVVSTDPVEIAVQEKGPAVVTPAPGQQFRLSVTPGDAAAQIYVINHALGLTDQANGELNRGLPSGIYKVKLRIGADTREHIILLDGDIHVTAPVVVDGGPAPQLSLAAGQLAMERPRPASAAPREGNSFTHEYHIDAAAKLGTTAPVRPAALFGAANWPATAEIRLMARVWTSKGDGGTSAGAVTLPWKGVELRREDGVTLVKFDDLQVQFPGNDPFVTARVEVVPGAYFLWQRLEDGRELEQSLMVPKDWALEVFLLALPANLSNPAAPGGPGAPVLSQCAVLMKPMDPAELAQFHHPDLDRVMESSRIALADERNVMNEELRELLMGKSENPLAGILGAHLIIAEAERSAHPVIKNRLSWLDEVVPNLRSLLGSHHPDVEAISLRCPSEALRTKLPIHGVPMFERSWRLLQEAMDTQAELVPLALWERVHAAMSVGGFLVWAADKESRDAHQRGLEKWIRETEKMSLPAAAPELEDAGGFESRGFEGRGGLASAQRLPQKKPAAKDMAKQWARKLGIPVSAMSNLIEKVQGKP